MSSVEFPYVETLYSEAELAQLASDTRFLAIAHAYSLNVITLGEAIIKAGQSQVWTRRLWPPLARDRVMHEAAERIRPAEFHCPMI